MLQKNLSLRGPTGPLVAFWHSTCRCPIHQRLHLDDLLGPLRPFVIASPLLFIHTHFSSLTALSLLYCFCPSLFSSSHPLYTSLFYSSFLLVCLHLLPSPSLF